MESYKETNRQLIMLNQELKIQINEYQREIISVRQQLMDEHEMRVLKEHKLKEIISQYFKTALAVLEPECNVVDWLLENSIGIARVRPDSRLSQKIESAKILQEVRQSNLLQQRRSSITNVSPTRRRKSTSSSSSPTKIGSSSLAEEKENDLNELNIEEQNLDKSEYVEQTFVPTSKALACINEANEEQADNQNHTNGSDSNMELTPIVMQDNTPIKSPESLPVTARMVNNRRTLHRRCVDKVVASENLTNDLSSASSPHLVVRRGKRRSFVNNIDESIEVARCLAVSQRRENDSFVDFSEITLRQFANASSSTPNSTHLKTTTSINNSTQSRSGRSARSCKPKSLAEPSLRSKLRNDGATISKKTSKKKK